MGTPIALRSRLVDTHQDTTFKLKEKRAMTRHTAEDKCAECARVWLTALHKCARVRLTALYKCAPAGLEVAQRRKRKSLSLRPEPQRDNACNLSK